jgi:hypothetical protein
VKGQIVVNADEWTLSDRGFGVAPDAAKFSLNVIKYFVGENKGKFHALSNNFGLTGTLLEQTITKAGHVWTKGLGIAVTLDSLAHYDAIFIGGDPVDNQVLIDYVKNGGKVYLCAGTGQGGAQAEANRWNTFLAAFGLQFGGVYKGIGGNVPVGNAGHPLFAGVQSLYQEGVNLITDLQPDSPLNLIILSDSNGQGLIATAEFIKTVTPPVPVPVPEPAPAPEPLPTPDDPDIIITAVADVYMSNLVYKGQVKRTQSDEYVELTNRGNKAADISGWKITSAGSPKQWFIFPKGSVLDAGKSFRVYTNEVHPETGGFSFASKTAIWNDLGDELNLFNAKGENVATLAYGKARKK